MVQTNPLGESSEGESARAQTRLQGVRGAVRSQRVARILDRSRDARTRLGLDQRSLSTVAAHRGTCSLLARLARRARRPHPQDRHGHERADADLSLPPVRGRAGVRNARDDVSGARDSGGRHGRVAQRGAGLGPSMARAEGAHRSVSRSDPAHPDALVGRAGELRRCVLQDAPRHHLRSARDARADLHRRRRPVHRQTRRLGGRRIHLHERQEVGSLHADAAAERAGRTQRGGARARTWSSIA